MSNRFQSHSVRWPGRAENIDLKRLSSYQNRFSSIVSYTYIFALGPAKGRLLLFRKRIDRWRGDKTSVRKVPICRRETDDTDIIRPLSSHTRTKLTKRGAKTSGAKNPLTYAPTGIAV